MGSWDEDVLQNDTVADACSVISRYVSTGLPWIEAVNRGQKELLGADSDVADELFFIVGAIRVARGLSVKIPESMWQKLESLRRPFERTLGSARDTQLFDAALHRFKCDVMVDAQESREGHDAAFGALALEAGDCLSVKVGSMSYGGVFVATKRLSPVPEKWYRLIPLAGLFEGTPSLAQFLIRCWRVEDRSHVRDRISKDRFAAFKGMRVEEWPDRPAHIWCEQRDIEANAVLFDVIGNIDTLASDPVVLDDVIVGERFGTVESLVELLRR